MAVKFGSIFLQIEANIASLKRDMDQAQKTIATAGAKLDRIAKGIGAAIGGYIGWQSVRAFAGFVQGALDSADALVKMSQKTGLTVEALSGLQHAASLSDVSVEQLATGLKQLSKNASDAAGGAKEQAETFKAIGVETRDATGAVRPLDQLLADVSDRFASWEDGAGKSAIAMRLFGKAGADMIPLLNGGSAGMAEATEEARKLGLVVSTDTAQAAERFNDNMTRLKSQLDVVARLIAEAALPSLERVSEAMVDAAKNGDEARESLRTMFDGAIDTAMFFKTLLADIGGGIGAMAAMASQFELGDTWEHPAKKFWRNWAPEFLNSDSSWARAARIDTMAQEDSKRRWQEYWDFVSRGGAAAVAAGVGAVEFVGPALDPRTHAADGTRKRSAPVIDRGGKTDERAKQLSAALESIREEAEAIGKTEIEIKLAKLIEMGANSKQLDLAAVRLGAIADEAKRLAEYEARVAERVGVWDQLASIQEQIDTAGMDEYQRAGYDYALMPGRTEETDRLFTDRIAQLKTVNEQLDATKARTEAIKGIATDVGGVLSSAIVAPLQDGFKGLKTYVDMLRDAIVRLVQEMAAALIRSGLIKLLSTALDFVSPGWGSIFGQAAGAANNAYTQQSGSGFQLEYGTGWGNGTTAYAGGGKVLGPGGPTSDSVRLWGSRGEWMIQQKAAAHYGDRVMAAINSMRIPRAALQAVAAGGMTGMPIPGRGETHYHFASLDPLTGLEMMRSVAAPGLARHLSDGTAGLLPAHIRAATAAPRAS